MSSGYPWPPTLQIASVIKNTQAEGPGRRVAIWVQGCPLHCPGCCNPEMIPFKSDKRLLGLKSWVRSFADPWIEGITLLGGEPIAQATAVAEVCESAQLFGLSVMLFTGYTMDELQQLTHLVPDISRILNACDILVDGRYDRSKPETKRRWVGSANQEMHFLTDRYDPSDPIFRADNTVEIRLGKGEITVNGWPQAADALLKP